jgi:hypothetical protein
VVSIGRLFSAINTLVRESSRSWALDSLPAVALRRRVGQLARRCFAEEGFRFA